MKFKIEQLAICPKNPAAARALLEAMGAVDWTEDHVTAVGELHAVPVSNEADLSFNYDLLDGKEFEILNYTYGRNWMQGRDGVSHLGMHCSVQELWIWKRFFEDRGINIAQEVLTTEHTNPAIAGKRRYNYVIFDTRDILGVDLKFIVRLDNDATEDNGGTGPASQEMINPK